MLKKMLAIGLLFSQTACSLVPDRFDINEQYLQNMDSVRHDPNLTELERQHQLDSLRKQHDAYLIYSE